MLAARLAQDPAGYSVAVVEAGSFYEFQHGNLTQVPGYNGWSVQPDKTLPSLIEWDVETTPQVVGKSFKGHLNSGLMSLGSQWPYFALCSGAGVRWDVSFYQLVWIGDRTELTP